MAREHPLSWHRVLPIALVVALGLLALLAVRGPDWYQRLFHPLRYETVIARESASSHLDPYLVAGLINTESGFREGVVSNAGAVGLMQVKPSTAKAVAVQAGIADEMTPEALSDPETNIRVGVRYLAYLVRRYGGDVELALAAYNAGLGNADRWSAEARKAGGTFSESIAFPETARYVDEVRAQSAAYRALYPDVFADSGK